MRTLVLAVDRDDDIGVKTGIKGPLIGRDENLAAATKLGLADPEDADVNTVLTAISIYDELIKSGKEAEVATICGDVRVGTISDGILTGQLEQVIEETRPTGAFLVSDGAEDESIYPMIASRIRIDHVRRVFVRQAPAIESTYYMIARAMKDKKIQRRILFPIGLVVLIFSSLYLFSPLIASSFAAFAIGLYLIFLASGISGNPAEWARKLGEGYERFKGNIIAGDVSIIFSMVSVVCIIWAIVVGWDAAQRRTVLGEQIVLGAVSSLWWFVFALLFFETGRVVTAYLRKGKVPKHVLVIVSTFIAMGLIFFATLESLSIWLGIKDLYNSTPLIFVTLGFAILLGILGVYSYRRAEERLPADESWRH